MATIYLPGNIKTLRKKFKLTQAQLASQLNRKHTSIGNWETGFNEPSVVDLTNLASIFGVSVDDLIHTDLSDVHLNSEEATTEKGQNVHLNVNRSVHLNDKKGAIKAPLTADKTAFEMLEKLVKSQEKTIASQEAMIQLQANKIGELEEIKRRLESEIPEIGQPVEDKKREVG